MDHPGEVETNREGVLSVLQSPIGQVPKTTNIWGRVILKNCLIKISGLNFFLDFIFE